MDEDYISQQSKRTGTAVLHTCSKCVSHTFWLTLCDRSHRYSHFNWCPTDVSHLKLIWTSVSVVMFYCSIIVVLFFQKDWLGEVMECRLGESLFNFRAGPAQISFHFCRISWVVVWLCVRGEDRNAVPDADGTWHSVFLVLKSHFLIWIRVRRLLNWCPTILLSWENISVNNIKTQTQHTDWSSCETKLNVVWLIINRHIIVWW